MHDNGGRTKRCRVSYSTTTSRKGQSVQRSWGHDHVLPSCFFLLLTGVHVLSRLFLPPRASAQHISATVYRVAWLRARRVSGPRRHSPRAAQTAHSSPPAAQHSHILSLSQRHSQWQNKGGEGSSDELDWITTSLLASHPQTADSASFLLCLW